MVGSGAGAAAAWVTVTETPAAEIVALSAMPELGATTRVTEPEPVPEDAPETVIQLGRPETVQGQKAAVWTLAVRSPPEAGACNEAGATE
jgi:uncharacterized protein YfaQ (DUF2300 family)